MKRILSILLMTGLLALGSVSAQDDLLRKLFILTPDSILPTLSTTNRLDMMDFMDAKMRAEVTNTLSGTSEMTALTGDSLSIRMSEVLRVDMLLREAKEEADSSHQVICVVRTYLLPSTSGQEQVVSYFSVKWNPLPYIPNLLHPLMMSPSTMMREDDRLLEIKPIL